MMNVKDHIALVENAFPEVVLPRAIVIADFRLL